SSVVESVADIVGYLSIGFLFGFWLLKFFVNVGLWRFSFADPALRFRARAVLWSRSSWRSWRGWPAIFPPALSKFRYSSGCLLPEFLRFAGELVTFFRVG